MVCARLTRLRRLGVFVAGSSSSLLVIRSGVLLLLGDIIHRRPTSSDSAENLLGGCFDVFDILFLQREIIHKRRRTKTGPKIPTSQGAIRFQWTREDSLSPGIPPLESAPNLAM